MAFQKLHMDGRYIRRVRKGAGPALSSAGLSPKVMLGSAFSYANSENYFGPCVSDPSCDQYVSIVSGHGYGYPTLQCFTLRVESISG